MKNMEKHKPASHWEEQASRVPGKMRPVTALVFLWVGSIAGFLAINGHARPSGENGAAERKEIADTGAAVVLACPGRVEGLSELVGVSAGIDGVLASLAVKEGQQVSAGQTLAVVDRRDLADELSAAKTAAASTRPGGTRPIRGSPGE